MREILGFRYFRRDKKGKDTFLDFILGSDIIHADEMFKYRNDVDPCQPFIMRSIQFMPNVVELTD